MVDSGGFQNRYLPLVFFSGMGADERVFAPQREAFPTLRVPRWIKPGKRETLANYAARMAREIDPGVPFYTGGASFGGMVAVEAARRLPHILGCFLIGSVRSPRELPRRVRCLRPAAPLAGIVPFGAASLAARVALPLARAFRSPAASGMMLQLGDADPAFLRWACRAVMSWETNDAPLPCPVHQIHGDRDRILPWRLTKPDVLVRGGGHVLTLSHPQAVNNFIVSRM